MWFKYILLFGDARAQYSYCEVGADLNAEITFVYLLHHLKILVVIHPKYESYLHTKVIY